PHSKQSQRADKKEYNIEITDAPGISSNSSSSSSSSASAMGGAKSGGFSGSSRMRDPNSTWSPANAANTSTTTDADTADSADSDLVNANTATSSNYMSSGAGTGATPSSSSDKVSAHNIHLQNEAEREPTFHTNNPPKVTSEASSNDTNA